MAGPVDTRVSPTSVNDLATAHPIEWFEKNLIATVPGRYPGAYRRVYPGFVQLGAFMSMNMPRHVRAHIDLFDHIRKGEDAKADANRKFYDEYFSVADLPAEFYLVPQEALCAAGRRPLRRVQRQALGDADLSDRAQHHPGEQLTAAQRPSNYPYTHNS